MSKTESKTISNKLERMGVERNENLHRPRVGIAGAGLMGRFHLHAARQAGANVVAIADVSEKKLQRIVGNGDVTTYRDVRKMIETVDLEILHICTPSQTHENLIRMALERRVHVFVEKPLAATEANTRDLSEYALNQDVLLCPVHQYAFQRSMETMLNNRHKVGTETHFDLVFHSAGGQGHAVVEQNRIAADILPHAISILQRFFQTDDLRGAKWQISGSGDASWNLNAVIQDVAVHIRISLAARPTCIKLDLWGTNGALHSNMFHDFAFFRNGATSRRTKITQPFTEALSQLWSATFNLVNRLYRNESAYPGLRTLTEKFYRACQGDAKNPISADESAFVAAIRDRFLASTNPARAQNSHSDAGNGIN